MLYCSSHVFLVFSNVSEYCRKSHGSVRSWLRPLQGTVIVSLIWSIHCWMPLGFWTFFFFERLFLENAWIKSCTLALIWITIFLKVESHLSGPMYQLLKYHGTEGLMRVRGQHRQKYGNKSQRPFSASSPINVLYSSSIPDLVLDCLYAFKKIKKLQFLCFFS